MADDTQVEVTRLLADWRKGDDDALECLSPEQPGTTTGSGLSRRSA